MNTILYPCKYKNLINSSGKVVTNMDYSVSRSQTTGRKSSANCIAKITNLVSRYDTSAFPTAIEESVIP